MTVNKSEALGIVETKGMISAIAATDAMCKAANVAYAGQVQIGNAFIATFVRGDAGGKAASEHGELVSAHVIPRPDAQVLECFLGR